MFGAIRSGLMNRLPEANRHHNSEHSIRQAAIWTGKRRRIVRAVKIERNFYVVMIYQELNNVFYLNVNHNRYRIFFIDYQKKAACISQGDIDFLALL